MEQALHIAARALRSGGGRRIADPLRRCVECFANRHDALRDVRRPQSRIKLIEVIRYFL
jgi:hypothetical protein